MIIWLVDTGLVAYLDATDESRNDVVEGLSGFTGQLATTSAATLTRIEKGNLRIS